MFHVARHGARLGFKGQFQKDKLPTIYAMPDSRLILFVIYPGVTLLDVSGPAQVFSTANAEINEHAIPYETAIASDSGGLIKTDTGVEIQSLPLADFTNRSINSIIVAGGNGIFDAVRNTDTVDWLKAAMPNATRVVSTCMGVFLTAETGYLESKTVTTHWRWTEQLQSEYPKLNVVCEPIFVRQGNYLSSAGVSSGIDLSLSLVEEDHDRQTALAVARNLVLYLRRTGAHAQFSSSLQFQFSEQTNKFDNLNTWIDQHLDSDLSVDALAKQIGMSSRNFSRAYTAHVGCSPAKAVEVLRLEKAKLLLETTDLPLKTIAIQVGFIDQERMRRTFMRHTGISPTDYRQRFGNCNDE